MKKTSWVLFGTILLIMILMMWAQGAALMGVEESEIVDTIMSVLMGLIVLFIVAALMFSLWEGMKENYPVELIEIGTYRILASGIQGNLWYFLLRKTKISKGNVVEKGKVIARFAPFDFVFGQTKEERPGTLEVVVDGNYRKAILYPEEPKETESSEPQKTVIEEVEPASSA